MRFVCGGSGPRPRRGRLRDLRRRPAAPLREPRRGRGALLRGRRRRPEEELSQCRRRLFDKIWESPRGRRRPPLHRPPPRARGDLAAGVRVAAAGRPPAPPPRPHAGHGRPQRARPTARPPPHQIRDQLSRVQVETLERNCARVRRPDLLDRLAAPGHRARDRPGDGRHAAGHDDRLRRLAHLHPRRLRRAGLRHRHQRGRARARHPDAAAAQAEVDADPLRGRARLRRDRQGPDPRHDRPDRRRRAAWGT